MTKQITITVQDIANGTVRLRVEPWFIPGAFELKPGDTVTLNMPADEPPEGGKIAVTNPSYAEYLRRAGRYDLLTPHEPSGGWRCKCGRIETYCHAHVLADGSSHSKGQCSTERTT